MIVASFLNELEVLGYPIGTYPMDFNKNGNIMLELQIGHDHVAVVVLDEIEDEFIVSFGLYGVDDNSIALCTQVQDKVIDLLDNYIADFGY